MFFVLFALLNRRTHSRQVLVFKSWASLKHDTESHLRQIVRHSIIKRLSSHVTCNRKWLDYNDIYHLWPQVVTLGQQNAGKAPQKNILFLWKIWLTAQEKVLPKRKLSTSEFNVKRGQQKKLSLWQICQIRGKELLPWWKRESQLSGHSWNIFTKSSRTAATGPDITSI